ncbi:MAG: DUF4198 domain-containing protein [Rhodobacteraceae bacterium]|nr:DUF4198 domain-containing protein [Paracoccaceae bacterium]
MNWLKACFVSMAFGLSGPLLAHEYWIEPLDFTVAPDGRMMAFLKVGSELKGSTFPYIPAQFQSFTITNSKGTLDHNGIVGDSPALQVAEPVAGLNILAYHSNANRLTYRDPDLLEKYLLAEGLDFVLEAHRENGWPEIDITETYTRNAKALVQVGPYDGGEDQALGLPFELVVEGSPYAPDTERVRVQLLWQGAPVSDYPINVFIKEAEVTTARVHTDQAGFAEVDVPESGFVLLNSVHIARPESKDGPFYESFWASMTFGR